MAVVRPDGGNIIRKMLPKALVAFAAVCTVFLAVQTAQADLTMAWALPAAVYLVAAVVLVTPLARRRVVRVAMTAVMAIAAIGIGLAFYVLFGRQPSSLVFGLVFLWFAVIDMLAPRSPRSPGPA